MELAMVGLGRMGGNMTRRLIQGDHRVVAHNRSREPIDAVAQEGAVPAYFLKEAVEKLEPPRAFWLMVPAGPPVDSQIDELIGLLDSGDIIIDGGNSRFTETMERAKRLEQHGIHFVDAGVSGGVWGLQVGYCLMVGGPDEAIEHIEPALYTLAPKDGYLHVGPSGSGHYVKMIHNGIEYGLMQAYAEGFEILESSQFDLDLRGIAHLWNHGSVVRSWLLELAELAFEEDPHLDDIQGYVEDSGEGRWTVHESIELAVSAPAIYMALASRFMSRKDDAFSNRMLAALRHQFGGHAVKSADD